MPSYSLTTYSKGSGCGCKLPPEILRQMLRDHRVEEDENLLVANGSNDDAAVYKINDTHAMVSTLDFFTPIVNDAFDFGRIAAANAISDVYAMGAKPLLANAILSWPIDHLPIELASKVIAGAQSVCKQAGISLAGGHSINGQEPLFGLSVSGWIETKYIKRNNTITPDQFLYVTKPLGIGVLAAAHKRNILSEKGYQSLIETCVKLNSIGEVLANKLYITAITDITGFGLIGHLSEMLSNHSDLSAKLYWNQVPILDDAKTLMEQFVYPDNTTKNYNAVKDHVEWLGGTEFLALCDPQTSGGLLIAVDKSHQQSAEAILKEYNQEFWLIGEINKNAHQKSIQIV